MHVYMHLCQNVYQQGGGERTEKDSDTLHRKRQYVRMYLCIYACTYICMYVRLYIRIHVCMYVCTYMSASRAAASTQTTR